MKLKLFKVILIFIILLISCGSLAGCTTNNEDRKNTDEEFFLEKGKLELAKLTFYFINPYGITKPDTRKVLDEIEKRTADTLNVKLDFQWLDVIQYNVKIRTMVESNEPVDAFLCYSPIMDNISANFYTMAKEGKLKDITELFPKAAPDLYAKYTPEEIDATKVDGKVVFVPSRFPQASRNYAIVRKDLKDRYKIPDIKNFEDYELYLKTIKQNVADITPGMMAATTPELTSNLDGYVNTSAYYTYKSDDPSMKLIPLEQSVIFKEVVTRVIDWFNLGYLHRLDKQVEVFSDARQQLLDGKISSCIVSGIRLADPITTTVYEINKAIQKNNPGFEVEAYPLFPEIKAGRMPVVGYVTIGGSIAFNANSKNVERALRFLQWIQENQQNYDLFMYGLEGVHYVAEGENSFSIPDKGTIGTSNYIGWEGRQAFRNIEYERFPSIYKNFEKQDYVDFINNDSIYSPLEGFYPDYRLIIDKVGKIRQIFNTQIDSAFLRGLFKSYEDVESIAKQLEAAGTNEVAKELERQLQDWKKNSGRK